MFPSPSGEVLLITAELSIVPSSRLIQCWPSLVIPIAPFSREPVKKSTVTEKSGEPSHDDRAMYSQVSLQAVFAVAVEWRYLQWLTDGAGLRNCVYVKRKRNSFSN